MSGYSRVRMDSAQYPSQFLHVIGTISERFADSAFYADLPNGKVTVAFLEQKNRHLKEVIQPGDRVELCICPADFERARIDGVVTDGH